MGRLLLQLLLNSIIFINTTAFFYSSSSKNALPTEYRLPDYVIPEHYNIKLEPLFMPERESFNFYGICDAYVKIINPTWYISLHAQKPYIEIQNISLFNPNSLHRSKPTNVTYNNETHILIFRFDSELRTGYYLLNMSFIGLSDNDAYFIRTPYIDYHDRFKKWFAATQFRAIGARQLFPCWDEPAFKATINIIVSYPMNYWAVSSMPIQSITYYEGTRTTYFKTTRLMSTYLVSLALHDIFLEWLFNADERYEPLILRDTMFAKNLICNVTMRFESEWKYSENLSYVDHLITPAGPRHNGMGLILYKVSNVFYDETLDPVSQKMRAACLIAYEMARQWFNNLISPSWWSDYWLNEGIARLLGMDIINKMFQDSRMLDLFAVQSKQESLYLDYFRSGIMKPLISEVNKPSEINSLFSSSYYIKAPVILRMLQQLLSDEVFQQGIEIFLDKHKFSSATTDDFWSAMQAAQNVTKISNIEKFNVKEIMNAWTKQKHYPVLKITYEKKNLEIFIVDHYMFYYMPKGDWFIPIIITAITTRKQNSDVMIRTWKAHLKLQISDAPLGNRYIKFDVPYNHDDVIIVNFLGYYRVNYELENWQNIAKCLNSADYTKIHVLNRAQIIDDAFYFLSKYQMSVDTFFELIKYLSQETDYVAWYPMIKALERMSGFIPISDERVNLIKKSMQEILNKVLEQIGYEERSEEDYPIQCLRQEVAKWACTLEHPKCLQMAKYKLEQYVIEYKKLLPWWKEWTYCKGIMTEKNLTDSWSIWNKVFKRWMSNSDNRILEFLTCIAHPNSIKTYLDDIKLEAAFSLAYRPLQIRDIDRVNRFIFTIIKHAKKDEILEHILNNFEELKPREVNTNLAMIIIINHVYSKTQLEKITEFVEKLRKQFVEGGKYTAIENPFTHEYEVHKYMKNLINQRILFIHRKIEKRIDEIMILRNELREIFHYE